MILSVRSKRFKKGADNMKNYYVVVKYPTHVDLLTLINGKKQALIFDSTATEKIALKAIKRHFTKIGNPIFYKYDLDEQF